MADTYTTNPNLTKLAVDASMVSIIQTKSGNSPFIFQPFAL